MPVYFQEKDLQKLKMVQSPAERISEIRGLSKTSFNKASLLIEYNDYLLFHKAFPSSPDMLDLVQSELERVAAISAKMYNQGKLQLEGSALAGTEITGFFGLDICNWLSQRFPGNISLYSVDADADTVISILQLIMPGVEYQHITQGPEKGLARLRKLTGIKDSTVLLNWVLGLFNDSRLEQNIKEDLFLRMKIFCCWKLDEPGFNRSMLALPVDQYFFQEEMIRRPDAVKILKQPVGDPVALGKKETLQLLDTIRGSLSFLYRETDPFSFADLSELQLFDMGRGMQIALVGMRKGKRLSLESYIGFMAFKNGVPIAYGGGWIWGQRCKIGVNIYPAFRKGESAWQFAQIMRLYYQNCGVRHFIVKPYQFGKDNPEGLKSGAFWFYYRFGYRPMDKAISETAEKEWDRIQSDKSYRTPVTLLRHFTGSAMEWKISKQSFPASDAGVISKGITDMINSRYQGNRWLAINSCSNEMNKLLKGNMKNKPVSNKGNIVWENWCLLAGYMNFLKGWTSAEKKEFLRLIQLKQSGKEIEYVCALQEMGRLWKEIKTFTI